MSKPPSFETAIAKLGQAIVILAALTTLGAIAILAKGVWAVLLFGLA